MKVLIADDEDITLCVLEEILTEAGFEVLSASNGKEAWEIINRGQIRLVVTDWYMPEMDGVELCKKIRSTELPGYVYVILLTSHDRKQDIVTGLSAGADDFVAKPFDKNELILRVQIGVRLLSLRVHGATLFALAKLADYRDAPESGLHLERIRRYSRIIASELGKMDKYENIVTAEYVHNIYLTSPLHDIGKAGISDSALQKPDELTNEKLLHADRGVETIESVLKQFPEMPLLEMARDIIWCHHEKYDGSGYPRGLKGEEIPLAGRIVALADMYDALTSKRLYKETFAPSAVHSIIVDNTGRHFDPDIVKAFQAGEPLFLEVLKSYPDKD